MDTLDLHFTDHSSLKGREDRYRIVQVDVGPVLKSWRESLFSFEWLRPDGTIRALDELPMHERDKRLRVEQALKAGQPLERPVLGIGLLDNVEIGAGRETFLTLAALGRTTAEVHIPNSNHKDFSSFIR